MGKFLFFPISVTVSNFSTVGQGRSGVRFPPGPLSLGIQLYLSMYLLNFPHRFLMDQLSLRFSAHFCSVDLSWIRISCTFILFFHFCECTACVYRSFECTFGPTVARSIFQMHSKKGFLKRATRLLLFATTRSSISVLVHIPHAFFALSSARYRSLNGISKKVFCVVRGFPRPIVPKNNFPTNLAKAHVCGRFCSNTVSFFWRLLAKPFLVLFLDPVRVGRGFDLPLVQYRSVGLSVVFDNISPEFGAHAEFATIFPKICHYFGTFIPSPIFPKNCHNFGTFHEYKLLELSFCVSVILNLPHATVALLNSL